MERHFAPLLRLFLALLFATTLGLTSVLPVFGQSFDPPKLNINIPTVTFSGVDTNADKTKITVPYLAEYISGIYNYLILIAGVVAATLSVIGGFQYLTAGGDAGKVKAAKERITNAVAGVILLLGAYTILKLVSPALTDLKGLEIPVVKMIPALTAVEITEYADVNTPQTGGRRGNFAFCRDTEECRQKCDSGEKPGTSWGGGSEEIIVIPSSTGLNGGGRRADAQLVAALQKAGEAADAQGYRIDVKSGWRTSDQQFNSVCNMIKKGDTATLGDSVAWPGSSNHEQGLAVDVELYKKSTGEKVVGSRDCAGQEAGTLATPEMSKVLDKLMTDAGFARYKNEIWHFDFGTAASNSCRCRAGSCPAPPISCSGNC
jgi:hypothetical protein